MSNEQLERNKRTVTEFYDRMFNQCKPREAMERYSVTPTSSTIRWSVTARRPFIEYFVDAAEHYPGKHVEFVKVIAEGNYVVLRHCRQEWPGETWAGMRHLPPGGDADKVVEHWDVAPDACRARRRNPNGMF